jgi:hypothetical protein
VSSAVSTQRFRILVLGYIVRGPIGGLAWHHLQYVLGLAAIGHDVCFLEDSDDYPGCYDPDSGVLGTDPTYGLAFIARTFERLGLAGQWAYHDAHAGRWSGPAAGRFDGRRSDADLLIKISGMNPLREWCRDVPRRVFVDTDPVFTQIRHLTDPAAHALAMLHTHHCTFGENVGQPDCLIPDDGFRWRPTRQPIVLDQWPVTPVRRGASLTTVMQWDSYAVARYGGREFGMKSASFPPYQALPERTGLPFEIALGGASAPRTDLIRHGWVLRDPLVVARDPWSYQEYLAASLAEFGVAKDGYVSSRSGWFSERSAAYLASGRAVVVQDTGCSRWLKADGGVLFFTTPDEAIEQLREVAANPSGHGARARDVAAAFFDARGVLSELVDDVMSHR